MQWIAKDGPIYVWSGDTWFNERDKEIYHPDLARKAWVCGEKIVEFTKKTKICV